MTVYVEQSIAIASLTEEMKTKLSKRNNIALHLVGESGVSTRDGRARLCASFLVLYIQFVRKILKHFSFYMRTTS